MNIFKCDQPMPMGIEGSVSATMLPGEEAQRRPVLPGLQPTSTMSTRSVERPRRGHDM
jgi:hypothetical protein